MGQRIQQRGEVVKGVPLVQPGDDLFWFNKPPLYQKISKGMIQVLNRKLTKIHTGCSVSQTEQTTWNGKKM